MATRESDQPALELVGIDVTVADGTESLTILRDLDLRVAPGEIVSVTGASGSGKSTLLGVASLLRQPTSGTVHIDGLDTGGLGPKAVARLRSEHLGLVFQSSNLFPSLTAVQQVEFVAHIAGRLDAAARRRANELLDAVGLADQRDRRPAQLSGGERQRVGIARALMNEPAIIVADEPTASLDEARGRDVMDLLVRQARARGAAALIVTHVPDQLRGADRHVRIGGGRIEELIVDGAGSGGGGGGGVGAGAAEGVATAR